MALPSSGQITLNQVNVELGNSGTAQISMGSSAVRGLFGVASGQISMSNGYGKSNVPSGTGGTITTSGNYVIHTFTSSGTFTINQSIDVEYLVVAGGGSGCNSNSGSGGGGGAGGFRTNVSGATSGRNTSAEAAMTISAGSYSVVVGAGGAAQATAVSWTPPTDAGNNGGDSVFNGIVSFGGGAGGSGQGRNGGSGGGSGYNTSGAGSGTAGQGYDGAARNLNGYAASGGGGAGSAGTAAGGGADASGVGGAGGTGISSSIRGTATDYAGGGGGSDFNGGQGGGAGGSGGGGHGANYYQNSAGLTSGSANTGGGGGGSSEIPSGAGGSGIVVIRYLIA